MTIAIIIPSKDEPYLPQLIHRISVEVHQDYHVHIQSEPGLANAVLCGVKSSKDEAIVVLDADGSHPPKYIPAMVGALRTYDVVIGSRYIQGGATEDYALRRLVSRLFCKVSRALFRLTVVDTMSGFIVARRNVYEQLILNPVGYKFGLEIIVKGRKWLKIGEYPIHFEKRKMGYSKTGLGQGVKTLIFILKLWIMELMSHEF